MKDSKLLPRKYRRQARRDQKQVDAARVATSGIVAHGYRKMARLDWEGTRSPSRRGRARPAGQCRNHPRGGQRHGAHRPRGCRVRPVRQVQGVDGPHTANPSTRRERAQSERRAAILIKTSGNTPHNQATRSSDHFRSRPSDCAAFLFYESPSKSSS